MFVYTWKHVVSKEGGGNKERKKKKKKKKKKRSIQKRKKKKKKKRRKKTSTQLDRVDLDAGLDDIDRRESTVGRGAADAAGRGRAHVVHGVKRSLFALAAAHNCKKIEHKICEKKKKRVMKGSTTEARNERVAVCRKSLVMSP
jgi:hypothetical protein